MLHVLQQYVVASPHVDVLFCSKLLCEPLVLPGYKEEVVIQPGLFKGTYGCHGLELLLLTYEDDNSKAVITKITVHTAVQASHAVLFMIVYLVHVIVCSNYDHGNVTKMWHTLNNIIAAEVFCNYASCYGELFSFFAEILFLKFLFHCIRE